VTDPRVSTAGSLRINARCLTSFLAPRASEIVMTAGRASGMAATASEIAVRNIRREARDLQKASEMTEDDLKKFEEDIQELTNKYVLEMDKAFEKKSKEIMEF